MLEQGVLVNSIYRFPPQMVFFTTPELLEIGGLPFVSPFDKPTRAEALSYYRKVVDAYDLQIAYRRKPVLDRRRRSSGDGAWADRSGIRHVDRRRRRTFAVETRSTRGVRRARHARNVVMAIGYYDHPVMLGVPGEDLPHVHHYYGEPHPHYRQRVVIVGGGNSAAESALEHVPRRRARDAGASRADAEVDDQVLGAAGYREPHQGRIDRRAVQRCVRDPPDVGDDRRPTGRSSLHAADGCRRATGPTREIARRRGVPAHRLSRRRRSDGRAGVRLNERDAPVFNPETFETNVPGLFVAGGAIAGVDTGTIFIENGRFHGEKIIEVIARRVRSRLPPRTNATTKSRSWFVEFVVFVVPAADPTFLSACPLRQFNNWLAARRDHLRQNTALRVPNPALEYAPVRSPRRRPCVAAGSQSACSLSPSRSRAPRRRRRRCIDVTVHEGTSMSVAVSPDGRMLAVDLQGSIWTIPSAGGAATRITDVYNDARQPAWSPDGKSIAFFAYRDGGYDIWSIAPDGSNQHKLTWGASTIASRPGRTTARASPFPPTAAIRSAATTTSGRSTCAAASSAS